MALDEASNAEDTGVVDRRILIGAGVVLLVAFLLLLVGAYAVGISFGHVFVLFFLVVEFAIFLALLAVATWVVATVWKAVMRR
jgi:hypothetical protein